MSDISTEDKLRYLLEGNQPMDKQANALLNIIERLEVLARTDHNTDYQKERIVDVIFDRLDELDPEYQKHVA